MYKCIDTCGVWCLEERPTICMSQDMGSAMQIDRYVIGRTVRVNVRA
jgi:hypothetical protein